MTTDSSDNFDRPAGGPPSTQPLPLWHRIIDRYLRVLLNDPDDMHPLRQLQAQIFAILSIGFNFLHGPLMIYGAYLFYQKGRLLFAGIELFMLASILALTHSRSIPLKIRKTLVVVIFYLFSLFLLIVTGPHGAGLAGILLSFIMAISLLDKAIARWLIIGNWILFALLGISLPGLEALRVGILEYEDEWPIIALSTQVSGLVLYLIWNMIFDRLVEQVNQLAAGEAKYRLIAENAGDVVWMYNTNHQQFVYFSPAIQELLGYTVEEALRLNMQDFFVPLADHPTWLDDLSSQLADLKQPGDSFQFVGDYHLRHQNGSLVWAEVSSRYHLNKQHEIEIIGVSRDITARKQRDEQIEFLLVHDQLTGLFNRNALKQRAGAILSASDPLAVIFLNIDKFRLINDALGHRAGDQVLIELAEKIDRTIKGQGDLYRIGGDEFVAVVHLQDTSLLTDLANRILQAISRKIQIGRQSFYLTASIGLALGIPGHPLEQSLKNAETAVDAARQHRIRMILYEPEMDKSHTRAVILDNDLHHALANHELEVYYQPILDLRTGRVNQVEALLRWHHPEYGLVSPAEFIPIAEHNRLILPITDWVLAQAIEKIADWNRIGLGNMIVSVNLSPVSFDNQGVDLPEFLSGLIQAAAIEPGQLKLEITEGIVIRNVAEITQILIQLKAIGIRLALDDFGTGYSSFGYLKDLPLNIVKLDRALTNQIDTDARAHGIIAAMVAIIHGLGLEIVAEGVETESQLAVLKSLAFDHIQGYLISKPLPAHEFEKFYFSSSDLLTGV